MDARERLENAGYEDVVTLSNYSYDDALIGEPIVFESFGGETDE